MKGAWGSVVAVVVVAGLLRKKVDVSFTGGGLVLSLFGLVNKFTLNTSWPTSGLENDGGSLNKSNDTRETPSSRAAPKEATEGRRDGSEVRTEGSEVRTEASISARYASSESVRW